jgi:hypothetical protein
MLDAYIINRIRREREREGAQVPLRIEVPLPPAPPPTSPGRPRSGSWDDRPEEGGGYPDRGSVHIDFRL